MSEKSSVEQLRQLLDESRRQTAEALERLSPDAVVYPESGWRVRDVLIHVAAWEAEAARSIEAFARGGEYRLPRFTSEGAYNAELYQRWKDVDPAAIQAEWDAARNRLAQALASLASRLDEPRLILPWGERNSAAHLIRDMAHHEREHAECLWRLLR